MGKIRGTHSSPGIYTHITDLEYSANNAGITSLGLVGETLQGPAFEPIKVSEWNQFKQYFGGTCADKHKINGYPKYELPYIAKSFLKKAEDLYVCRVLGLSGYNAGPTFLITASSGGTDKTVVAVLRARGVHEKFGAGQDKCATNENYDRISYACDTIELSTYTPIDSIINDCSGTTAKTTTPSSIKINSLDYGSFTITAKKGGEVVGKYAVTLNFGSKDYIYNVLGSKQDEGSAALFVEELYDIMLQDGVDTGKFDQIDSAITVPAVTYSPACNAVSDFVTVRTADLKRKHVGRTFLCSGTTSTAYTANVVNSAGTISDTTTAMTNGIVYKVTTKTLTDGSRKYVYVSTGSGITGTTAVTSAATTVTVVRVASVNQYYTNNGGKIVPVFDLSNYCEQYRCASTPWVVSQIMGDSKSVELKKLFRFHTISDGNSANSLVKISITNILPDEGKFDVVIRDFYDTDDAIKVLEIYRGVTMVQGEKNYIGLKMGTADGEYPQVSKYVQLEIIANDMTENCVPEGFLGYPVRDYTAYGVKAPTLSYNTYYNTDIRPKKQYFGMSDISGVDLDILTYKGAAAYKGESNGWTTGYSNAFHLDSALKVLTSTTITVDGDPNTTAITWNTVSPDCVTSEGFSPRLTSEQQAAGTIYEDVKVRKFTIYPYGGFDGWDIYRGYRTTNDEFKAGKYKGAIKNGYGNVFSENVDRELLGLSGKTITSDYYAFLGGANQFRIPEKCLINIFATPGIDYVKDTLLTEDIINMLEEYRGDSLYVVTTPDRPEGAGEDGSEMYTADEMADNRDTADIDSYYAATYGPWVRYYDAENSKYISLPPTKDALRDMADVDNKRYPWIAPAGTERGEVECKEVRKFLNIDEEDTLYNAQINPIKKFSKEGIKIWGNKTMYMKNTPMKDINIVRLVLYMRKLIKEAGIKLIFDPNDATLKQQFEDILKPILDNIKTNRGITDYRLKVSQTAEEMDEHELNAILYVKPTPVLEYIGIEFVVTPQGVTFTE